MSLVVGQFNDSYEPIMDGVANVTKNYAYWLNKNNCQCYVVTPVFPQYKDSNELKVLRYLSMSLPRRRPYRLGVPRIDVSFGKKINQIPFDIVHAHCPFSSGQVALKIARKRGIPIVTTFHSKYYDDFKQAVKSEKITKLLMKRVMDFYNAVDFVWAVNHATAQTLRSYGFKGTIDIVNNGTDFLPPDNMGQSISNANSFLKVTPEETVLLFVGQHIWQKNLKMLLESLYYLKASNIKFKMFFVGTGYAEAPLKSLARQLNLQDCVTFLGMLQDRDLLKSLFCRGNLFLFPSVYDNAPIVIREAAAVGCPSLVIENSNASENIEDNYNGFLCKNDEKAFAIKIKDILSDKSNLQYVGNNAQITLYKSWQQLVAEVKARYEDIINTYKKINAS